METLFEFLKTCVGKNVTFVLRNHTDDHLEMELVSVTDFLLLGKEKRGDKVTTIAISPGDIMLAFVDDTEKELIEKAQEQSDDWVVMHNALVEIGKIDGSMPGQLVTAIRAVVRNALSKVRDR